MSILKKIKTDENLSAVTDRYAVAVTDEVFATMQSPDTDTDPVARQYLPTTDELIETPDELNDPIGDHAHSPVKGIVHRYPDRVLLTPVHVCAVYCRFCFRREKVGPKNDQGQEMLTEDELDQAIAYIQNTPDIWEVVLTGGDPLVLSPRRLKALMDKLSAIDHVKIIRLHTRVPIANPKRMTPALVDALKTDKTVYMVLHCNHANELNDVVAQGVDLLLDAKIPLLSQSTLLAGVNDDPDVLENLFRRLTIMKIKPYYLHHPDKARGTGHFRLSLKRGQGIVSRLWGKMSGIAQPRYVLDIPGGFGKVPVSKNHVAAKETGYDVTDIHGDAHDYQD